MRRSSVLASLGACIAVAVCSSCSGTPKTAPAPAKAEPVTESEYRIGPGDQLSVFVFNHPELGVAIPVRPDGLISIPLAENVTAAGRTPSQLARDLEAKLAEYVRSPKVNVIVTSFQGSLADQIRVVGAAAKPQSLPYRANMTVLDVMIAVGGLGPFAAGNRAEIIRREGDKQVKTRVRLDDLLNDGDISANVAMLPGDVLIIPESRF
jgi:polysaccharide export outer membrane protein